jgi:sugar lactone lactonase YvrE
VTVVSTVTTLAGATAGFADGSGAAASFSRPTGVPVDAARNVWVVDNVNNRIRKVTAAGMVTTLAGAAAPGAVDDTGAAASFKLPTGGAVDAAGNVYVADQGNNRIRKITAAGVVTTLAGAAAGYVDGTGTAASFSDPRAVAVDKAGNVYVADGINQRIRKVTPAGVVTTLAGSGTFAFTDGTGAAASFANPSDVAVDLAGNVYVADRGNHAIRMVTATGIVSTVAGTGSPSFSSFDNPTGIAVDLAGNVYVADTSNHRIQRVAASGKVTTLAGLGNDTFADGAGATAGFSYPQGVGVDATGNVYVADTGNARIRKVSSIGIGQLVVKWTAPSVTGTSAITGYQASATAMGNPTQTCTTAGPSGAIPTSCTISGLPSGVAFSISVTATNAAGTSAPAASVSANPN